MTAGLLAAEPILVRFTPVRARRADSAIMARQEGSALCPRLRVRRRASSPRLRHLAATAAAVVVAVDQCQGGRNAEIYTDKRRWPGRAFARPGHLLLCFYIDCLERVIQPLAYARYRSCYRFLFLPVSFF